MSNAPRTPDDGRNERQRQQQDKEGRRERQPDDGRSTRQRLEEEKQRPDFAERMQEERQRPDFLERTRPDDPSDHQGQLTRDNVNPDIPSAEPGKGEIVDPNTLGMSQAQEGVAPPEPEAKPEQWPSLGLDHTKDAGDQVQEAENRQRQAQQGSGGLGQGTVSINEPPGSQVLPEQPDETDQPAQRAQSGQRGQPGQPGQRAQPEQPEQQKKREPLPSDSELHDMTRAELDELAEEREVDTTDCSNKQDVIDALKKDARKRK